MRKPETSEVTFTVVASALEDAERLEHVQRGVLIDSSDIGIGMTTDGPIEPGSFIKLSVSGNRLTGVVMWSLNAQSNYRVGVRFLGFVPEEMKCL